MINILSIISIEKDYFVTALTSCLLWVIFIAYTLYSILDLVNFSVFNEFFLYVHLITVTDSKLSFKYFLISTHILRPHPIMLFLMIYIQ